MLPGISLFFINEEIKDAAMFISTSNYEGISNSMLEALAMGIPSICTDCPIGGARSYIEHEKNGLCLKRNSISAFIRPVPQLCLFTAVRTAPLRNQNTL